MNRDHGGLAKGILLSVRPRFCQALLDGSKSVELRRRILRLEPGAIVAVYETSPTMALAGFALVGAVLQGTPDEIWARVGRRSCLSKQEYIAYYSGSQLAVAIEVSQAIPVVEPLPLQDLRRTCPEFTPPQSFCYVAGLPSTILKLLGESLVKAVKRAKVRTGWSPRVAGNVAE